MSIVLIFKRILNGEATSSTRIPVLFTFGMFAPVQCFCPCPHTLVGRWSSMNCYEPIQYHLPQNFIHHFIHQPVNCEHFPPQSSTVQRLTTINQPQAHRVQPWFATTSGSIGCTMQKTHGEATDHPCSWLPSGRRPRSFGTCRRSWVTGPRDLGVTLGVDRMVLKWVKWLNAMG